MLVDKTGAKYEAKEKTGAETPLFFRMRPPLFVDVLGFALAVRPYARERTTTPMTPHPRLVPSCASLPCLLVAITPFPCLLSAQPLPAIQPR